MSDFARMMELAIAGGANPEEVTGMKQHEDAQAEAAKAGAGPAPAPHPASPAPAPQKK